MNIAAGIEHKFSPSAFKASLLYDYNSFRRTSGFAANTAIARQNTVNLKTNVIKLGLAYAFNDKFTLRGGFDYATLSGYHPVWNPAANLQNAGVTVANMRQTAPWLGFDYDIAKNTQWCFDIRYYNQRDGLAQDFRGANTTPYSFSGIQMLTQFKVKF